MGRKRILTKEEILLATGELIKEEGIHGVHFKKLSDELQVSRSTLYEYYRNKEDLILSYLKNMMEDMNQKIENIPSTIAPNDKLYRLLYIFLEHAENNNIDQMIRELQSSNKNLAMFYRTKMHEDLMKTYEKMILWIEEAKNKGIWKKDSDSALIGDMIFHSILFPNRKKLGVKVMADQLFDMMEYGVSKER